MFPLRKASHRKWIFFHSKETKSRSIHLRPDIRRTYFATTNHISQGYHLDFCTYKKENAGVYFPNFLTFKTQISWIKDLFSTYTFGNDSNLLHYTSWKEGIKKASAYAGGEFISFFVVSVKYCICVFLFLHYLKYASSILEYWNYYQDLCISIIKRFLSKISVGKRN